MRKPLSLAKHQRFRAIGSSYSRWPWYSVAVLDNPREVLVTLPEVCWPEAQQRSILFAVAWAAFVGFTWSIDRQPLRPAGVLGLGAVVTLWPLYVPFLRQWFLKRRLPWIRFDKETGEVQLLGGSRKVPVSDVVAICDAFVRDRDYDYMYELQILLKKESDKGTEVEHVLLSGGWHQSAIRVFGPLSRKIACLVGIPHVFVDVAQGTYVEQTFERSQVETGSGGHNRDKDEDKDKDEER